MGVSEITYEAKQDKVNNPGLGIEPVSRGHGVREYSGSIKIHMTDIQAIRNAVPGGKLLDLPAFDIIVLYGNPGRIVTDILKQCEFTTDASGGASGDTLLESTLDLIIGDIIHG